MLPVRFDKQSIDEFVGELGIVWFDLIHRRLSNEADTSV